MSKTLDIISGILGGLALLTGFILVFEGHTSPGLALLASVLLAYVALDAIFPTPMVVVSEAVPQAPAPLDPFGPPDDIDLGGNEPLWAASGEPTLDPLPWPAPQHRPCDHDDGATEATASSGGGSSGLPASPLTTGTDRRGGREARTGGQA